jgi:ribonuclease T1
MQIVPVDFLMIMTKITVYSRQFFVILTLWLGVSVSLLAQDGSQIGSQIKLQDLPPEARQTLLLIKQGGPFPYEKDGSTFGNYEGQLPKRQRGYYREFTVKTPYARNRGARRIIAGGERLVFREFYYTADHYASFKRIKE